VHCAISLGLAKVQKLQEVANPIRQDTLVRGNSLSEIHGNPFAPSKKEGYLDSSLKFACKSCACQPLTDQPGTEFSERVQQQQSCIARPFSNLGGICICLFNWSRILGKVKSCEKIYNHVTRGSWADHSGCSANETCICTRCVTFDTEVQRHKIVIALAWAP
jgi:hypothetical protein